MLASNLHFLDVFLLQKKNEWFCMVKDNQHTMLIFMIMLRIEDFKNKNNMKNHFSDFIENPMVAKAFLTKIQTQNTPRKTDNF